MQTDKKAKKATTLLELLISVVLLSIMVVFAICIMGISGSAASESASELQVLNAYDIFLDTYVDAVKNAYDVSVADGTRLFLATPTATHTFEFIHNRLYMDEEELLKAGNGSFAYGSGYVTLRMQPEGYGTIELKIAPDVSPDAAPQITPVQERKIRAIRVLSFPYKVTYLHGETIDTSGLTLELLYSDGTKEIVDSGFSTTPITADYSSPFFTVTYDGGEQPFTSAIPLDVYRNLANVTVVSEQNQKDYSVGETFNPDGLRLKVSYSDGNSEIISSGFDCADISDKPPGSAANRISFTHRDTTMSVLVPVRIFAVIRTVPSQDGTLTYNTAVQSPAWKDYDSGALTIGGTTSGQNAGEYTASFTPKGYNWWSDRTQDARTAAWVIAKAQQTIAVPSDTVSIHIGKTEDIFAVSGVFPGGSEAGTISYTSDDPAKAAVDTETGKVTAVSPGTCTVRIVAEETANYLQDSLNVSITVTDHSYADDFTTDTYPTCTEPGEKSRHCTYPGCDSRGEITAIPALGHVDGEYTVTVAPTCTAAGTKVGYCTRCGKEASIPIPPLGHDWGSWIVEPAATCTDNGEEHRFCTRCGEISRQVIPATGHSFSAIYSVDVPPTCTTVGSKSRHCLNPGCEAKIDNTVVEVLPHPWGAWETTEESTCIEIGKQHRLCAVCGAEEIADVPLKAHSYAAEFTVDSEPTCSTEGSKSHHCTTPGCTAKTDVTSIATVAHPYGDWITDTSATCSAAGTKHRICTQCGAREDGTIAKTGHNYTSYLYSGATCTSSAQYYDSCTRCGASTGVYSSGSALGHSWGSYIVTKSATCTTAGSQYRTCSRCGATDTATIPALGHSFSSSYFTDVGATCTTAGSKSHHCTRTGCGATTGSTSIPALGHSYTTTGYSPYSGTQHTVIRKCKNCGADGSYRTSHTNADSNHKCSTCGGYVY